MTKNERIHGFSQLKEALDQLDNTTKNNYLAKAFAANGWFTNKNIELALNGIRLFLDEETMTNWLANYTLSKDVKTVGIIMAGNIPLVGFHDFLSVLLAGHKAIIKPSSQDKVLIQLIIDLLITINEDFGKQIQLVDKLPKVDAVIATGSDNSSRYFQKYFGTAPHIIRKNRTSVAVLSGGETESELNSLGDDIFSFFGLGCRNVAKIYVPFGYDMTILMNALEVHNEVIQHPKYFNNYEYNKAIFLVNKVEHFDTGYVLMTKNTAVNSPLAVVYYEEYTSKDKLIDTLTLSSDKLQCVVSTLELMPFKTVPFGKAQWPAIDDYADSIDTMKFLSELSTELS